MNKYEEFADKYLNELQVKFPLSDARKELAKRLKEFCDKQGQK